MKNSGLLRRNRIATLQYVPKYAVVKEQRGIAKKFDKLYPGFIVTPPKGNF